MARTPMTKKPATTAKATPSQRVIDKACDLAVGKALREVGTLKFLCPRCGELKRKEDFYVNNDPRCKSGISYICRDCTTKIALGVNEDGVPTGETKETICEALQRIDKPFLIDLYNSSIKSFENQDKNAASAFNSIWSYYIKNVSMINYKDMLWKDSIFGEDHGSQTAALQGQEYAIKTQGEVFNKEVLEEFEQNQSDAIRLLGYDPFCTELPQEQPYLYAQLVGYLDVSEEANQDQMRTATIVDLVRNWAHLEKCSQTISSLMSDPLKFAENAGKIKMLEDVKTKITANIAKLAEQSCISLKFSKTTTKGEDTWTGKVRKMKEMRLRDAENNLFDACTAEGIQQVAELSDAALLHQIKLDENDVDGIIQDQRKMLTEANKRADIATETSRILLRENYDLKSTLVDMGQLDPSVLVGYLVELSDGNEDEEVVELEDFEEEGEEEN